MTRRRPWSWIGEATARILGAPSFGSGTATSGDEVATPSGLRRPLKVLMIVNQFPKSSETFIVAKLLGLTERGFDVHVACHRETPDQWHLFPDLADNSELRKRVHSSEKLYSLVARLGPDVVHFEFGNLARDRARSLTDTDARIVVSFRGPDLNFFGLHDPDYYRDAWDVADAVHVLGRDLWQRAIRRGCPQDKPHVFIPPAVDPALLQPIARQYVDGIGTAARPLRLLGVGRLHWMKGYEYALHCLRALINAGLHVEYRIIGASDYREAEHRLAFEIEDLGLGDHVSLMGALPRRAVREEMLRADILLHAAVSEGFCNAVLEAQALALPVVCTDADGLSENVLDGETGFVVTRRDVAALGSRVQALAADAELRRRMGAAGRSRVDREFSSERQIDRFAELYEGLVEAPPRAAGKEAVRLRRDLAALRQESADAERRLADLRREMLRREVIHRVRAAVDEALPPRAAVAVVSRGDDALLKLGARRARHFPQTDDGVYAGYHPGSSEEAIRNLEDMRERGAEFIVFPRTAFWWLDHYAEFREHLQERYRIVARDDQACLIFSLGPKTPGLIGTTFRRRTARKRRRFSRSPDGAPAAGESRSWIGARRVMR